MHAGQKLAKNSRCLQLLDRATLPLGAKLGIHDTCTTHRSHGSLICIAIASLRMEGFDQDGYVSNQYISGNDFTCSSLVLSAVLIGMISWGMTGKILLPPAFSMSSTPCKAKIACLLPIISTLKAFLGAASGSCSIAPFQSQKSLCLCTRCCRATSQHRKLVNIGCHFWW